MTRVDPTTYRDAESWERQRARLMPRVWHFAADAADLADRTFVPLELLPGALDEPLVLAHDGDKELCLSNVCTHRGALLCDAPSSAAALRCPYHGRRFGLDGRVRAAPGFDGTAGFPSEHDHLPRAALAGLGPLRFVSLEPQAPFDAIASPIRERLSFLDLDALAPDPRSTREFAIDAHWALWCDNYLEGLHIPYVHPALARTLDLDAYHVELLDSCSLQIGVAREPAPAFDVPPGHRDHGRRIGAYYFFLHPFVALNFYPWGLSLNAVRPAGPSRTVIHYRAYVWNESLRDRGPGAELDRVEAEDDAVVERAQRGVRARLYRGGGYAPGHEDAVRHFHAWLRQAIG